MDQLVRRQAVGATAGRAVERTAGRSGERPVAPEPTPVAPVAALAALCPVKAAAEVLSRPARRRGKELEQAIFEATLDQLTSGGFARLTMEGVAGAARTGKAALYRRWASKVELVIDALDSTLPRPSDTPDLGSTRSELLLLIEGFTAAMGSRAGAAMNALMSELDHEQAELFKDFITRRVIEPTKGTILDILRRGAGRGDVRPGAATPLVADVAPAMLMYRVKTCGREIGANFAVELVDEVMMPLIRA
ncbi:TetR/AcrR family transcriptional regulator [Kitasatospora sp. RG8]|uniref:TetR/AcrR family transcriptional regulator n=1 Tax=Kitasatospora sp. RG8 TaxID=2820815 RepID=UPI001ADF39E1|nr:TetR/AcrR family transcriptional regulator [Kitasatospora sp. RG8]MBP0453597.1 TetR/AcrR family transcriptional regulator [Kitasatospora sp. RG8]